jgi:NADPH-dependent 7-cyano-7-deazaguanine reductase QueF
VKEDSLVVAISAPSPTPAATADHDHATEADPAGLGRPVPPQDLPELAVFPGPASLTSQTLKVGQLAKRCPSTGRPDQFSVQVTCTPVGGRCLELESLVRHLEAYHTVAVSAEVLADQLAAAVLEATGAAEVAVTVHQTGREGADLDVTARHPIRPHRANP